MARKLVVEVVGDTSGLQRSLGGLNKSFSGSIGQWVKGAVVFQGVGKAMDLVGDAVHRGISEWENHQKVAAQTQAVLKSTGGVANVSAKQVGTLATALMNKSGVDDEAIQSGENLLLTFRNIRNETGKGNDMFNQATKAALDLSVAFHKDLNQSAILVGKALNDPLKGLTALQRVGVQFTQDQREQIKALLDTGKTAKDVAADQANAAAAVTTAQNQQQAAAQRVTAAQDAMAASERQLADAHDKVRSASRDLTDAHTKVADAVGKVKDAQDGLVAAQDRAKAAQESLTAARRAAKDQLDAMKDSLIDTQFAEQDAAIRVARAQERLDKVMADSTSTDLDKREALLNLQEAQRDYEKAQKNTKKQTQDVADAEKKGVEGSKDVIDAKKNVKAANDDVVKANEQLIAAQRDVIKAQQGVADKEHALQKAHEDVTVAALKVQRAHEKVKAAQDDAKDANVRLAAAQKQQAAAQDEVAGKAPSTTNLLKAQKIIMGELKAETGGAAEALGKTLPGQLSILNEKFNNWAGDLVAKTIPVLEDVNTWLQKNWPQAAQDAKHAYEQYLKPLFDDLYIVSKASYDFISGNWSTIGPIVQGVGTAVEGGLNLMVTPLKLIRDILTGDWSKLWGDFIAAPEGIVKGITAMWKPIGAALKKAIVAGLSGVGDDAWQVINNIGDYVENKIGNVIAWGARVGNAVKNAVMDGLAGIGGAAWSVIANIGGFVASQLDTVAGWGRSVGRRFVDAVGDALDAAIGGLSIAKDLVNSMIRLINKQVIDRINSALEFEIPLPFGKSIDVNPKDIPHIPLLAAGGIVTRPTLAMIGERGPEAVVPLAAAGPAGVGGVTIHYHGTVISERDAAKQIATLLYRERRRGNPAFVQ